MAAEATHVHILVSWREFTPWEEVRSKLKNLMSLMLGRYLGVPGRCWFSGKGSRRRVQTRTHFDYLMRSYFPKHRWVWREGDLLPVQPSPRTSVLG